MAAKGDNVCLRHSGRDIAKNREPPIASCLVFRYLRRGKGGSTHKAGAFLSRPALGFTTDSRPRRADLFKRNDRGKDRGTRQVLRILRGRFSLALRWRGLLLGLRCLYALLERLHQVNDLCTLWRFWCCNCDFSAFALLI